MKSSRDRAAFFPRRGAGRACAAVLAAAIATMAAPSHPARAEAIPARSFVQDSDDSGLPVAATAGETAAPTHAEPGGVRAASAHPADAPRNADDTEPFGFVPTLRVTLHPLPEFDQPQPTPVDLAPRERLLFTPTGGGPAVALQLFLPAGSPDGNQAFGAGEDMAPLPDSAAGAGGVSLAQLALTDTKRGYLAQLAPDGLDTLREARCAAARPRPAGCEDTSDTGRARGGPLSGLSFTTIPLPSAVLLLLGALACLGAVAWHRRRLGL